MIKKKTRIGTFGTKCKNSKGISLFGVYSNLVQVIRKKKLVQEVDMIQTKNLKKKENKDWYKMKRAACQNKIAEK